MTSTSLLPALHCREVLQGKRSTRPAGKVNAGRGECQARGPYLVEVGEIECLEVHHGLVMEADVLQVARPELAT